MRKEIQALRAFAVLAVFAYHMRPEWVTGGFVGVDVFFVLSGFLISSHLLIEINQTGTIKLGQFWSRRARRLLPASLTVILASGLLVWFFAPQALQQRFFRDISGAALYVANWIFAFDSVDYLASENSPSVVQHFWSLGVEEQLYFFWPLLLIGATFLLSRRMSPLTAVLVPISAVTIASFAYSSLLVFQQNPIAYFSTFSRAWEFGLGAIVASLAVWRPNLVEFSIGTSKWLAWFGWASLGVFVLVFDASHGFPGWWALVPCISTVAILLAGNPQRSFGLSRLIEWKPVQYIGDASYSIYLWHWPLLILGSFFFGRVPWYWLIAIFVATLVLADLSMRFIERPFRFGALKKWRPRFVLASAASAMSIILIASQVGSGAVAIALEAEERKTVELEQKVIERLEAAEAQDESEETIEPVWDETSCMGPAFLVEEQCGEFNWESYVPAVGVFDRTAHEIEPLAMSGSTIGCLAWKDRYDLITCTFGVIGGEKWVLIGDSHAYQWLPALNTVAQRNNIELHLMARAGCPPNTVRRDASWDHQQGCISWQGEVLEWFEENPDVKRVIVGTFSGTQFLGGTDKWVSQPRAIQGFIDVWSSFSVNGADITVIRDTPFIGEEVYACVERNPDKISSCDQTRQSLESIQDNAALAAQQLDIEVVDMWDYFCDELMCPIVVGGIRAYKDSNHFSGTFGLLLAAYLEKELFSEATS